MPLDKVVHVSNINRFFLLMLLLSMSPLIASFGLEILMKLQPCKLCIFQRWGYFFTAVLSIFGMIYSKKHLINFLLLIISTGITFLVIYHLAIQLEFLPDSCSIAKPMNMKDFKQILAKNQSPCGTMHWLFGLPISVWSLIFSVANSMLAFRNYKQMLKSDRV